MRPKLRNFTDPLPAPAFRTTPVHMLVCDLCPSRAYTGTISEPSADLLDSSFSGRGWKLFTNQTCGRLQVCPRCARKLSDRWTEIPIPAAQETRA